MSEIGYKYNVREDELNELIEKANLINPIAILEKRFCLEGKKPAFFDLFCNLKEMVFNWDKGRVFDQNSEIRWEKNGNKFHIIWITHKENIPDGWEKEPVRFKAKRRILLWGKKVEEYLFSWDEIPGNDDMRIIEYLKDELKIEWAKTENIGKIDDGKTIIVSNNENSLSLKLNDEKNKVNLKIDDGRVDEFTVKTESGKLNIYVEDKNEWYEKQIPRILNYPVEGDGQRAYLKIIEYLMSDGSPVYRFKELITE